MAMPAAFASLESPNYRRYWSGQLWGVTARGILIATLGWLVIRELNAGGTLLGLASGALYAPGLLLGPWSGLLGDRAARRRRMMSLGQLVQAAGVLWIAALTALDLLRPWQLVVLALLIGLGETIEIGSRQPFIGELVNDAQLPNALALNGALYSLGRLAGPGLAAALLPVLGASPCLVLAGVGHLMVVVVLRTINLETLHTRSRATRRPGQIRETLSLVVRRPELRWTLLPLAAVGALAFEFPVVYPLLAAEVDDTGAAIGLFLAVLGAGALFGALVAAQLPSATSERMAVAFTGLGLSMAASAVLRDILALLVCVSVAGACSIVANSAAHARLQLATPPEQRGRISSLYALAKDGSTALGAPLIGAIAAATNVRVAIAVGALTALVGANAVLVGRTRRPQPLRGSADRRRWR